MAWVSRKLKFIPLSTCEAEVGAMVMLLKEGLFVRGILRDFGLNVEGKKMAAITEWRRAALISCERSPARAKEEARIPT